MTLKQWMLFSMMRLRLTFGRIASQQSAKPIPAVFASP
jgi:hypothetical protein